jgi:hypothetical protein
VHTASIVGTAVVASAAVVARAVFAVSDVIVVIVVTVVFVIAEKEHLKLLPCLVRRLETETVTIQDYSALRFLIVHTDDEAVP